MTKCPELGERLPSHSGKPYSTIKGGNGCLLLQVANWADLGSKEEGFIRLGGEHREITMKPITQVQQLEFLEIKPLSFPAERQMISI